MSITYIRQDFCCTHPPANNAKTVRFFLFHGFTSLVIRLTDDKLQNTK